MVSRAEKGRSKSVTKHGKEEAAAPVLCGVLSSFWAQYNQVKATKKNS